MMAELADNHSVSVLRSQNLLPWMHACLDSLTQIYRFSSSPDAGIFPIKSDNSYGGSYYSNYVDEEAITFSGNNISVEITRSDIEDAGNHMEPPYENKAYGADIYFLEPHYPLQEFYYFWGCPRKPSSSRLLPCTSNAASCHQEHRQHS